PALASLRLSRNRAVDCPRSGDGLNERLSRAEGRGGGPPPLASSWKVWRSRLRSAIPGLPCITGSLRRVISRSRRNAGFRSATSEKVVWHLVGTGVLVS